MPETVEQSRDAGATSPCAVRAATQQCHYKAFRAAIVVLAAFTAWALARRSCADDLETEMRQLVEAWESREHLDHRQAHVDYEIVEHATAEAMATSTRAAGYVLADHEIQMKRRLSVTFRGSDWRFDEEGDQLFSSGPGAKLVARDQKNVFIVKGDEVRDFHHFAGLNTPNLGTMQRAADGMRSPHVNDVAHLPHCFYSRCHRGLGFSKRFQGVILK